MFCRSVSFLGHRISADGLSMEQDKLQAIFEWPTPKCVKDIQSFLGAASYYRRFIKSFAQISVPLTNLLKKDTNWEWTHVQQQSFDSLKHAMTQAPVLMNPDYKREFIITSDASQHGIGAVLSQKDDDGNERPVAYFSRKLNDRESNWSTYEQECLALVEALKHFRHYVEGKKVYLFTDHKALIHLNKQPKLTAKQARWISFINLFNYSIV